MKKLKLEALEVTSFDTVAGEPNDSGTVNGHMAAPRTLDECNDTSQSCPELDCTYGCTLVLEGPCQVSNTGCTVRTYCGCLTQFDCVAP